MQGVLKKGCLVECGFYWATPRNNIYSIGEFPRILENFRIAQTESSEIN